MADKPTDRHADGEMARAAACYALTDVGISTLKIWPKSWGLEYWKPKNRLRNLVRAGALIAAEIDRIRRLPTP